MARQAMKVLAVYVWWLFAATALAQTPPSSRLLTAEGKVEVARAGQAAWNAGITNQTLTNGDRIRTGSRSRATIRLSDASVLVVKELTTLELRPPQAAGANSGFDMKSGGSYFFNRERPGMVEFRTPLASGAIRGTEFHLTVAENGRTEVALFDGAVELTNDLGGASLVSNEQAVVDPGQAPRKTAMLEASSIIQWVLYYPAVLDADELGLTDGEKNALTDSLAAYRAGDLLTAQDQYPTNRQPGGDAERLYRAATLLAVGQVDEATVLLQNISTPLAEALRQMVSTVKGKPQSRGASLALASEWMAESYTLQAQSKLESALEAARKATLKSPNFGFAWARVAELEFSFGRSAAAQAALDKSQALTPRNAQAHAIRGFAHAAKGRTKAAEQSFEDAITLDPGLANGWLGRGLIRIRQGRGVEGRQDLQVAAAREPQRSMLRSYLGKAWSQTDNTALAEKELALAKKFDPNDPTPWLYSAIVLEQHNRVNDAVSDLEKSQELNDNRSVFRSRLLLDQDKAVRSANLARIYQDAGLTDWSVREAGRAVSYDYGNFSAHQFLANSYDALRDPLAFNLRYEAPAVSEYFIANLLSPVGATPLSQAVSQQEYTRLFDRDHIGVAGRSEYLGNKDWTLDGAVYGRNGPVDYAVEGFRRRQNGQRPNNDFESEGFAGRFRAQLTPKDTFYFEANRTELESGDVSQRYDQDQASRTLRVKEEQEPNVFLGYHREWSPGHHTLFLGARFDDDLRLREPAYPIYFFVQDNDDNITQIQTAVDDVRYRTEFVGYSGELQQIFTTPKNTLVFGARLQDAESDTFNSVYSLGQIAATNKNTTDLTRQSVYAYDQWTPWTPLQFTVGITYDRLHYPDNIDTSPITDSHSRVDRISPKAGLIWTVDKNTHARAAYTRSLGGVFFDNSFRLEPTQVGGFNQAYRSIASESLIGLVPGTRFETFSVGVDHKFPTRTYMNLDAELLRSKGSRTLGVLNNSIFIPVPDSAGSAKQKIDYEERSLTLSVNQLVGRDWAFGLRYRISYADLETRFRGVSDAVDQASGVNQDSRGLLQQATFTGIYNLPCGFFAQGDAIWTGQENRGDLSDLEDENLMQFNAYVGYRFLRRHAEARIGVLNITDQDYQLHPVNLYSELPRERMFYASFRFYF
jgi:Flp pilus assembly protein TadD